MDRRFLAAIGLMMLVVLAPTFLFKRPPRPVPAADGTPPSVGAPDTGAATAAREPGIRSPAPTALPPQVSVAAPAEDTVMVRSGLYEYALSTRGARIIGARLLRYKSQAATNFGTEADLVRPGDGLFGLTLVAGGDTVSLAEWQFTPSASDVRVSGETPLTFTASAEGYTVEVTYTFSPDDYRFTVRGRVTGLPSTGGLLIVGLGEGLQNNEADSVLNARDFGLVVKPAAKNPQAILFRKVDAGETRIEPGPFSWVAVKSQYFVLGVFAQDSAARWAAAEVRRLSIGKLAYTAALRVSLPVGSDGAFGWRTYSGPMEYPRLGAMGDEFDDVNPYGWPGFRTVMRPFALGFRWLFVWMHEHLGLAYGLVLILFGLLVRGVLWPLNQKAMRSAMEMQAIQPKLQEIQTRYKNDPAKLQQAMFALYKEHGVNPMGGCWPMLLPMPVLLALFFVLQSTIELRGVSFLWFPDLSRADPLFIIPVLSGLSMFALSKLGQRGLPPNPQAQMMMYMMPVMMTVVGFNFASGLNLYWTASNLASLPQQYLLGKERLRRQQTPAVVVNTKK
jgi:YidC/Oxa1 family membrane protein insertase